MYIFLYNFFLNISFPFLFFFFFCKYKYRLFSDLEERLGFFSSEVKEKMNKITSWIWIHSASVGEIKIVQPLIENLKKRFPKNEILFSVMTPAAKELVKKEKLADLLIFLPLDFNWVIRKTISLIKPKILILVETELWPNLIWRAKKMGAKIILINGRISNRSYRWQNLFPFFMKKVFSPIDIFVMRSVLDAERIITLGAPKEKVKVTGNMKYDQITNYQLPITSYQEFGLRYDDLIWVCGSTREGEEEIILRVYSEILKKYPNLKLILAPRHLNRIPEIENLLKTKNVSFLRKSQLTINHQPLTVNCLLWDSYGELMKAYAIATIVFVGGSLVPKGGHNILEPASLGKPIIFGPHMENFQEPAALLLSKNGAIQVKNEKELKLEVINLLENSKKREEIGEIARNILLAQQGATEKNFELIKSLL